MIQFRQRLLMLIADRLPVSVSIEDLDCLAAREQLEIVCKLLAEVGLDAGVSTRALHLVVDADTVSPQLAELSCRRWLGNGRLFVRAGASQMTAADRHANRSSNGEFWKQMSRLRGQPNFQLVYAAHVTSPCALLSAEVADAVLPATGIQVPVGSAWVPIRIDILRYANAHGHVDEQALERALHCAVDTGEALHEIINWPTPRMRHDAWLNRRLGIWIAGIGDLAIRRRLDPRKFSCLSNLDESLRSVRDTLVGRSRLLARQSGSLPALETMERNLALPGGSARENWQQRWQSAIEIAAMRHRNLLVLSPWSLFPNGRPAAYHYTNLVPLLALCDACVFDSPRPLAAWSNSELRSFHQHAWAVLQQKDAAKQIAEQV